MADASTRTPGNWSARPRTARLIRAVVFAGPLVVSVVLAWLASSLAPAPDSFVVAMVRWLAIAGLSTFALVTLDKLARRLLPLAALFNLTLAFPDQAPSRYQLALRRGSTARLRERIAEARAGRLGDTPAEAAERVLELVMALSVHDRLTRGHSERVRAYTEMIGEEMGLTPVELDRLRWAGLLHDVGKLMVSGEILNKPGRLTADEFEVIKQHPEFGRRLVAPVAAWLGDSARAVWEHHERWDGRGYPAGLSGIDISIAGRIVSVADAYDVMTSVRSYQKPVSSADARAELARCSGTQFDPAVVRAFLNISLGRLRFAMGPLSWLAQIPLLPSTLAAAGTQGAAAAATAVVGAAAASVGVGLSDGPVLPPSPPAEARSAQAALTLRDPIEVDTGGRVAVATVPTSAPLGVDEVADAIGGDTGDAGDARAVEPSTTVATALVSDTTLVTETTLAAGATTSTPGAGSTTSTTTTPAPTPAAVTTTVAPVAEPEAVATTSPLVPPTAATTTTTVPPPPAAGPRPGWLPPAGVPTAYHFDVPNQVTLPADLSLRTNAPTRRNTVTFDPDRDGIPGLTLLRAATDPAPPVVAWRWTPNGNAEVRTAGATSAVVYVAVPQLVPSTATVQAELAVCDAAGACTPLATAAASPFLSAIATPVTLDFGAIDTVVPDGGTLRLTLAVPASSPADVVLYADTRLTPSALTLTFP